MAVEQVIKQFVNSALSKASSAFVGAVTPAAFLGNLTAQASDLEGLVKSLHPSFHFDALKVALAKRFEKGVDFDTLLDIVSECGDNPMSFITKELAGVEGSEAIIDSLKNLTSNSNSDITINKEVENA